MKQRTAEAARLEADYFDRVRRALAGRGASEIEEIVQSLREHIEEELSGEGDSEITLTRVANVLEQLGPPEAYSQEGETLPRNAMQTPVKSQDQQLLKTALGSALCLPTALGIGLLAGWLAHRVSGREHLGEPAAWIGVLSATGVLLVGLLLGVAALRTIRAEPDRWRGQGFAWVGVLQLPGICIFLLAWLMPGSEPAKPSPLVPPRGAINAPRHGARATLEVRPDTPLIGDQPSNTRSIWEEGYRSTLETLRSPALMEEAIAQLPERYRKEYDTKTLSSRMEVKPVRSSFLLRLELADPDPERAVEVLSIFLNVYMRRVEKVATYSIRVVEAAKQQ
jgi:hypothetical protein